MKRKQALPGWACLHVYIDAGIVLIHLFTIRVLKGAWVDFCGGKNAFDVIFRFFWPPYLCTLRLKWN